jgi:cobalt-zinc-cadmium efflux system outer membrane protein
VSPDRAANDLLLCYIFALYTDCFEARFCAMTPPDPDPKKYRFAASLAAVVLWLSSAASAAPMTLDAAFGKVIASHPELRGFAFRSEIRQAELAAATLPPQMSLGVSVENAVGSGDYRGFDASETTLTLAGVIERGGKREARRAMAAARFDAVGIERSALQFDVLAETARRYLELVGWQARQPLLEAELAQRERMAESARKRFTIGAAPQTMALKAEADVAATRAALSASRTGAAVAARRLALMWNDRTGATIEAMPLPASLPPLPAFEEFRKALPGAPELTRFATERRIREARVRLAVAEGTADVDWELGVRYLAGTDDVALVAGARIPLGASRRAGYEQSIARAERAALEVERESLEAQLDAALLEAWSQANAAAEEVRALESEVLPKLREAAAGAERAYTAGALSYVEWSEVQGSVRSALEAALEAKLDWRRAMIEIQRLTAEPVIAVQ